jgi:hypothetical protein
MCEQPVSNLLSILEVDADAHPDIEVQEAEDEWLRSLSHDVFDGPFRETEQVRNHASIEESRIDVESLCRVNGEWKLAASAQVSGEVTVGDSAKHPLVRDCQRPT